MRATALLLLLLLVAAAVPGPAGAQGNPEGVRVLEDARGDVAVQTPAGTPVPVSGPQFDPADLLAADVREEEDGFFFTLWIAAFPQGGSGFEGGQLALRFRHLDVGYQVTYFLFGGDPWAMLAVDTALAGEYDYFAEVDLITDPTAGRLTAFVPRQLLGDRDGAPPFPGRAFEDFRAESSGVGFSGTISIFGTQVDSIHASDSAEGLGPFPIALGVRQDGLARLAADRPFRASNGEAATFIFEVEASNLGDDEALYRLEAVRVPAGWQVTFPQSQLRLEPEESRSVPVLATVPFAHQHGRLASFQVELRDLTDPANVGRVELGLHYTDPPQPAGHHDTLVLHSVASDPFSTAFETVLPFSYRASMNTLEDDPADDGVPVPGGFAGFQSGPLRPTFEWYVPLSPRLQMGLDADLTRTGTIEVPVSTVLPMPAAVLEGHLFVFSYAEPDDEDDFFGEYVETPFAQLVPTAPVEVAANSRHTFQATILPAPEGDYVPYDPDANLVLVLRVSFDRPATFTTPEAPVLQPGGRLSLPLLEYADPVDDLFTGDLGLQLEPVGGAERRAPPGGATVFTVNATGPSGRYVLEAHGPESAWVEFPADLAVAGDGLGRTQVVVRVPANATNGTVVDLVVEAAGGPADAVRSLLRLRVTVDDAAPDESGLAAEAAGRDAPGVAPLAWAGLTLAAATVLGRRRRP